MTFHRKGNEHPSADIPHIAASLASAGWTPFLPHPQQLEHWEVGDAFHPGL